MDKINCVPYVNVNIDTFFLATRVRKLNSSTTRNTLFQAMAKQKPGIPAATRKSPRTNKDLTALAVTPLNEAPPASSGDVSSI